MLEVNILVLSEIKKAITTRLEEDERSLRWFCNKNEIDVTTVSSWLNNKRDIRFSTFCKIASVFNISIQFYTAGKGKDNKVEVKLL